MCSKQRSVIWNFFSALDKDFAKCDLCSQKMCYKSSTSNMKRHMQRKHPTVKLITAPENIQAEGTSTSQQDNQEQGRNIEPESSPLSSGSVSAAGAKASSSTTISSASSVKGKIDKPRQTTVSSFFSKKKIPMNLKKQMDDELLTLFTLDYQPFRIVEDKGFRRFVKILNPSYSLPNRQTISKSLIPALHEKCINKCKDEIKSVLSVCLTTDCWTSINNESFIGITVHYLNNNFELKSMLLKCAVFSESHTSENLADDLKTTILEWGLENKILLAVSDNATNIVKAITHELKWRHFGCYAHTLNLIVQNTLKNATTASTIKKIKQIVGHFKRSSAATAKLMSHQKTSGTEVPKKIIQDVDTRWNSTFYMLARFIELEDSIRMTTAVLNTPLPQISFEEWEVMKDLVKILSPFENVTRAVSGDKYMTASLVIVFTGGLLNIMGDLMKDRETPLKCKESLQIVRDLKKGLEDRFKNIEFSTTLATCTFLDPRFKIYAFRDKEAVEKVKKHIINRISEKLLEKSRLSKNTSTNIEPAEPVPSTSKSADSLSIWTSIDKMLSNVEIPGTSSSRAIMEVQRYLECEVVSRNNDPFQWWKDNGYLFPNISNIVRESCCALATSVPCERLFSKTGLVLNDRRTRLATSKVEKLMFLNINSEFL